MGFLYTFRSRVLKLEDKRRLVSAHKGEADADRVEVYEPLGWFVQLNGSQESFCVAPHQRQSDGSYVLAPEPDLKPGQMIVVTMRAEPLGT